MTKEMTHGSPMRLIISFALPTLFGMLFQQLYNLVDTMIVGQVLGADALAAVGSTGSLNFLVLGFCMGLCSGFAIPVSQQFGAENYSKMRNYVGNGALLCGGFALVLTIVTSVFCRPMLRLMLVPEDVMADAQAYIIVIFFGIPAVILYNYLSAILRALGDSKSPVIFLAFSSILNIILDLLLLAVFKTGVVGAAIATVAAQLASGILCLLYIGKKMSILHLCKEDLRLNMGAVGDLCHMGIPMGLQYSVTAVGSVILSTATNGLGTEYVSAVTASVRLNNIFACPFDAMGATMATYCGQNTGARKLDRLGQGIRACVILGMGYYVIAALVQCIFGKQMSMLFLRADETYIISLAAKRLAVNGLAYGFLALVNILRFSIQGMGYSQLAMLAGLMELIGRGFAGAVMVPNMGFDGACLGDPLAWVLADVFLIPAVILCIRKLKGDLNYQHMREHSHPA